MKQVNKIDISLAKLIRKRISITNIRNKWVEFTKDSVDRYLNAKIYYNRSNK